MKKNIILASMILTIPILVAACGSQTATATEAPPTQAEADTPTEVPPQPTETLPAATDTTVPATETETATDIPATEEAATGSVSFANDVYPIFEASCVKCHGVETTKEGLDLLTYENLMAGSRNGTVLVPGDAEESLLVQLIVEGEMPNRGPGLTAEQIQIISDWINEGALNN